MSIPTPYEVHEYLTGFPELTGKPVRLYYLESSRSLKWKKSSLWMRDYSEVAFEIGRSMMFQNDWYSFKFVEENV